MTDDDDAVEALERYVRTINRLILVLMFLGVVQLVLVVLALAKLV